MKYFKRNGFVALVSMLSLAAYAEDILPLSVAGSETKEFIQASGYGIDTSNMIQQERIIQGTVLEEGTNEPLIGVNVVVKGTTIGTTTDIDGKYSIKIPSDKAVLVFSYIGQKTEEYSVKGLSLLNVVMKSDATMLSEVVVGSYFEGIGGHHIGTDMIWPMSLIMKALTAQDDKELQQCIQMLQKTHAGTGFMHESFHKDDPKKFTRSWFAWANTLFGELLWKTFNDWNTNHLINQCK